MSQSKSSLITGIIEWIAQLTRRPTTFDEVNRIFHGRIGNEVETIVKKFGANEDRREVIYIDPRIDRGKFFENR